MGVGWQTLVILWASYKELLLHLVENPRTDSLGNQWIKGGERILLESLEQDYYRRLQWRADLFLERTREIEGR